MDSTGSRRDDFSFQYPSLSSLLHTLYFPFPSPSCSPPAYVIAAVLVLKSPHMQYDPQ